MGKKLRVKSEERREKRARKEEGIRKKEEGKRKRKSRGADRDCGFRRNSVYLETLGEVAEWLKAPVSKTGIPLAVSRVRIPASPHMRCQCTIDN
jgi:hypothetical protein